MRIRLLASAIFAFSLVAGQLGTARAADAPDVMRIHFIDVGQGAATLVEFPCAAILIDTGGEDENAGEGFHSTPMLEAYLDKFFERRDDLNKTLALLAITHPHIDHALGAAMVMQKYKVENVVDDGWNRDPDSGSDQQHALDKAAKDKHLGYKGVRSKVKYSAQDHVTDPVACPVRDPKIQTLWGLVTPADANWNPDKKEGYNNANNDSVVFRIDYGAASILITGDLQELGIADLLKKYKNTDTLDADIYEVGHHGSHNATTTALLHAISPKIAVMAVGKKERPGRWVASAYGHPRKKITDMLEGDGQHPGLVSMMRDTPITEPVTDKFVPKIGPNGKPVLNKKGNPVTIPHWVNATFTKAIYATGWDGNVVIEAKPDGTYQVFIKQ